MAYHRHLPFSKWYDETIFKTSKGQALSRKNLIFNIRSQDGGSHIDPMLKNEEYIELKHHPDLKLLYKGKSLPSAHYASMRQIAWEIEASLQNIIF